LKSPKLIEDERMKVPTLGWKISIKQKTIPYSPSRVRRPNKIVHRNRLKEAETHPTRTTWMRFQENKTMQRFGQSERAVSRG